MVSVKQLSIELLLYIALQRGSLRYLLEWIETALECSSEVTISDSSFSQVFSHIDETVNCDCKKLLLADIDMQSEKVSANKAAILLMKVVSSLSFVGFEIYFSTRF